MGDVALTVPVLRSVLENNPNLQITLVSNASFEPFFYDIPRFKFIGIDLNNYKGVSGLYLLFKKLHKLQKWDSIIDLHSVMRTWVLDWFFKWTGVPVYKVNKGRAEKKSLTQRIHKNVTPLPHTTERYMQVFKQAGLESPLIIGEAIHANHVELTDLQLDFNKPWIGIAPFSKHIPKEWPINKVESLIKNIQQTNKFEILLFGGGKKEKEVLDHMANKFMGVHSIAGKLDLAAEIGLVKKLKIMVAMDSFNMHLAALLGVKVISIWGATHSIAGFGPVNGNERFKVEVPMEDLTCRPCSVFGSKPCYRGDFSCMQHISVEMVEEKINIAMNLLN